MADAASLNGQTVSANTINLNASVKEDTAKDNYTGINVDTVKAYVDGVEVSSVYANGIISADVTLADGVHTVKFVVADNMGNSSYITRQITVAADFGLPTITIVPSEADDLLIGSVYWVDLVASDIEKVDKVAVELNLNSVSQWQLANMEVAYGFDAEYTIDDVTNNATITFTANGDNEATGEAVLASLPIRTWESTITQYDGNENQTPEKLWSRKIIWPMDIKLSAYLGTVEFVDGTTGSFSMAPISVMTELYGNYDEMNAKGNYSDRTSWHIHTAHAIDDVAATCTTKGYIGRTFCDVCNSVVDWDTTVSATGHKYEVTDGVLKCACGKVFSGVYTDGKTYVEGVTVDDGWVNDSYYVDGVKLTGVQKVDGVYYNFGDDGISQGKYTGIVEIDGTNYYSKLGVLTAGWFDIDDAWYYFLPETLEAANGSVTTTDGITFDFVDGKVQGPVWEDWYSYKRCWYGPDYYHNTSKNVVYLMVEIDGEIYFFNNAGCMQTGLVVSHESNKFDFFCYDCGTDGKGKPYTGVVENMYFENGLQQMGLRLVKWNDAYYFIAANNRMTASCTVELTGDWTGLVFADGNVYYVENGVAVANGLPVVPGKYWFDADGKMVLN